MGERVDNIKKLIGQEKNSEKVILELLDLIEEMEEEINLLLDRK